MSRLAFALAMVAVVGAAAWAYHVNYKTKTALARVDRLHERIAAEREAAGVLRVEWAYLNAPDRLARLVARNGDRLDLVPMGPHHYDDVAAIPFPAQPGPRGPEKDAPAGAGPPANTPGGGTVPDLVASAQGARASPAIPLPQPPLPQPRPASWRPE